MGKKYKKKFSNHHNKPYNKTKRFHKPNHNTPTIDDIQKEIDINVQKESLREDQLGITEYVKRGEGFKGIIKSRFSDFHVNEIDIMGKVLHITDLSIPEQKEEELTPEEISLAKQMLTDVVTDDMWKQINDLNELKLEQNVKLKDHNIVFDVHEMNKEQRTKFHKVIGTLYKNKLASKTVNGKELENTDSEKRFISVAKSNGSNRNKWPFPGEFVHFLVHKENLDTSDVASTIASKLNLRPSLVNYCGTKDKRGKTTQKFCIKKRTPRQIAGTVKFLKDITLGNFEFKKTYIQLGDLRGNRFRIALRNLIGEREQIENSLMNVKEQGFINYFGFQRFGNCSTIPTYEVGIALLKADYKLACELILKPRNNDVPFLRKIRQMWWENRDSKAAAAEFYSDRFIEKKLLDGLAQYGEKDYAAALMKASFKTNVLKIRIPRNMLLLYAHSFQSLIFNYVASKRIKEFGLSVLPGDLVNIDKELQAEQKLENDGEENEEDMEYETIKGDIGYGKNKDYQVEEKESECLSDQEEFTNEKDIRPENLIASSIKKPDKFILNRQVKVLTEEEISNGTFTIHDVLLTLPGSDVLYPDNVIGSYYKEFIEKYDLSSDNFKHNHKTFAMKGTYRKLLVVPKNMTWEFKSYTTPDETLILSDLEVLQNHKLDDFKAEGAEPKYQALLLDFCLPPAAYATMMLRELLKCDTSAAAQSILQKEANKEYVDATNVKRENLDEKLKAEDNENAEESIQLT